MPRRGGRDRFRTQQQVTRSNVSFPDRSELLDPEIDKFVTLAPRGVIGPAINCIHGVLWTACTKCSKRRV